LRKPELEYVSEQKIEQRAGFEGDTVVHDLIEKPLD
jgi:hypothetical protein